MYPTVPLPRLIAGIIIVALLVATVLALSSGLPASPGDWWKRASAIISYSGLAIWAIFASSAYYAPWRILWRRIPQLNRLAFPDLNGIYEGSNFSNWPRVDAMREAARLGTKIDLDRIDELDLLETASKVVIECSLFKLSMKAKLPNTDSTSFTTAAKVVRTELEEFIFHYLYAQSTGIVAATDESSHDGAAQLAINVADCTLDGVYWTRRRWQCGLNTAGRLKLKRVSPIVSDDWKA